MVDKGLLSGAVFFDEIVPDDRNGRARVMSASNELLKESELVFFDPDNGIEIETCRPGHKQSSKYLLWDEVAEQYKSGKSILVYQHFRREQRQAFIARMSEAFQRRTDCEAVVCFQTANVAFFLLIQQVHLERLLRASSQVARAWLGQIEVIIHPQLVYGLEQHAQRLPTIARAEV
ncbi:MAG: hypothetical protein Q7S20_07095 [Gemmatimonadaceae bacterium]|nr:hypothetical protein [Gemmatimonadaceae bacterium]